VRKNQPELARLIVVDVMWSVWDRKEGRERYEQIIDQLLSASLKGVGGSTAEAYMHECHKTDDSKARQGPRPKAAVYELPPADDCGWPNEWLKASDWRTMGKPFPTPVAHASRAHQRGGVAVHDVPAWGDMFCTRIFMGSDCYRTAMEGQDDFTYWILIDMRFQKVPDSAVLWHTSLSWWSDPPRSGHHCPRDIDRPSIKSLSDDYVYGLIEAWNKSRPRFRDMVHAEGQKPLSVFDRSYMEPSFVVAVPERGRTSRTVAADEGELLHQSDALLRASDEMLWTRNYATLPHALLKGGVSAFRRFLSHGDRDAARYLLIPDTQARVSDVRDVESWHKLQEEAAAAGTRILTDLEAYAASKLDGIDSKMRITKNHVEMYQGVAYQAGTLWDALARLLPDARRRRLEIVHRSIEMIHQTLLQGVADLDDLVRNIDGVLSRIEFTADDVADRFHWQLDHPPADSKGLALRDSLRGGYFDRLRRQVHEAKSTASRVTNSYHVLLETIGRAFDERRVREGDRMQRPALSLALAFGVLGLAGVAQATLPINPVKGPVVHIMQVSLWGLTFIVAVAIAYQILRLRSLGRIVTPGFEPRFKKVREFLAVVSTDHLDDFRRSHDGDEADHASWLDFDKELCRKFVCAWDAAWDVLQGGVTTGPESYEAKPLRIRVERWTLQTLMLTERPRDFSRYPLPRLTCLYRVSTTKVLKGWNAAENLPRTDSAVSVAELEEALPPNDKRYPQLCRNLRANESFLVGKTTVQLNDDLWNDDLWQLLCTGKDAKLG
jgi:hypothetical protein